MTASAQGTRLLGSLDTDHLQLYYDGGWHDAADGKTFSSYEPAVGKVWATVAEAGAEDVDRAVRAARRAFEGPPGVINILPGYGARAGDALVSHPEVDKIAFTDSTRIRRFYLPQSHRARRAGHIHFSLRVLCGSVAAG